MPIIDPDQGVPLPAGTDLADNPAAFSNFYTPVMSRLILRYTSRANRALLHPAPILNETSIIDGETWYERWTGAKWLPATKIGVFKSADTIVNNSTVLISDPHLTLPVPTANSQFTFRLGVRNIANAAGDIKFTFAGPAGSTITFAGPVLDLAAAGTTAQSNWAETVAPATLPCGGAGATTIVTLVGTITTAAATGNLTLQWAQNAASVFNTTVTAFSWMTLESLG